MILTGPSKERSAASTASNPTLSPGSRFRVLLQKPHPLASDCPWSTSPDDLANVPSAPNS
jgi:hypothetical protein